MSKFNLSQETRNILEIQTLQNSDEYVKMARTVRGSITMLDKAISIITNNSRTAPDPLVRLKRLSECSLLIGLIWLDITMAYRVYLNAKEEYEVAYAVKQLIVTINEGFKQIYHYVTTDGNGNIKTSVMSLIQ